MKPNKYYTGIGSRNIPENIKNDIKVIARRLASYDYILRSGAADGADKAFEDSLSDVHKDRADIYLPWKGFKDKFNTDHSNINYILPIEGQMEKSDRLYKETGIIPHFSTMRLKSKQFHSRNVNQVYGVEGEPLSEFVIYYAPVDWITREPYGGTRSAVMLAKLEGIPTYNLIDPLERKDLMKFLNNNLRGN